MFHSKIPLPPQALTENAGQSGSEEFSGFAEICDAFVFRATTFQSAGEPIAKDTTAEVASTTNPTCDPGAESSGRIGDKTMTDVAECAVSPEKLDLAQDVRAETALGNDVMFRSGRSNVVLTSEGVDRLAAETGETASPIGGGHDEAVAPRNTAKVFDFDIFETDRLVLKLAHSDALDVGFPEAFDAPVDAPLDALLV